MGKIVKNYVYNVAYQILVLIVPIVTAPYLARVLGADNLGIYSYVNSSGNIITTIALLGIYSYGNRQIAYVREDKAKVNQTFWELELTHVFLGIIGTIIYFVYAVCNGDYSSYFFIYYPFILAQFIDCTWIYVGMEDMKLTVMKNFITKLVNVAGIFLFVKSKDDLWIYLLLLAVTTFIANVSVYTQLTRYVGKPSADIRLIPIHLKGSIGLFLPQMASLLYMQIDKVMLQWITGDASQVSFYDQAEKIVLIPLSIITVMSTVMMPRIANEYKKKNQKAIETLLLKGGRFALCLAMPMMFGMFSVARQFIPWYLGDEFRGSAYAIMILSPIVLLNTLVGISGEQYFTATNQIRILLKSYVTAAVVNVTVNAILIPHFGYIGSAAATVLSSLTSVVIQYYYLRQQVKIRVLGTYAAKYFAGAFLMAAGIWLVSRHRAAAVSTTAIQVCVGVLIYFSYLIVTRDDTISEAAAMLKKRIRK